MLKLIFYTYISFNWIIQLSVISSILISLILLLKKLFKDKLGVKFQYMIWFIIIFRLMVPQFPTTSFSMFNFTPKVNPMPPIIVTEKFDTSKVQNNSPVKLNNLYSSDILLNKLASVDLNYIAKNTSLDWRLTGILMLIWLAGFLVISLYKILVYVSFKRRIKKLPVIYDTEIINVLENCKLKMNISKHITLIQTKDINSPALFGFVKPVILLPENILNTLSLNKLNYVLLHELSHLKRGDIITNWIILFLRTLHWFNPVIQYGFNKMQQDMEIFCDSIALSYVSDKNTKEYGMTIINVMEMFSKCKRLPGTASIINNKSNLKRRIIMIKMFNKNSYKFSAIAAATLLLLGCTTLTDAKASSIKNQIIGNKATHQDKINYPFVNDPQLIGKWQSVDFVKDISDFKVNTKTWKGDLYVKELNFLKNGKVNKTAFMWTKDHVIDLADKTDSKCIIKDIDGSTYMFFEWKNGSYTTRGIKPSYYVMKKVSSTPSLTTNMFGKEVGDRRVDKIDYKFVNDPEVIGKWESVDFVKQITDFKPGIQSFGDLYLKNLTFAEKGKIENKPITWTKGIVMDKDMKTASKYTIKNINGENYMFFEWKSGDYVYGGMNPCYYVLKQVK